MNGIVTWPRRSGGSCLMKDVFGDRSKRRQERGKNYKIQASQSLNVRNKFGTPGTEGCLEGNTGEGEGEN